MVWNFLLAGDQMSICDWIWDKPPPRIQQQDTLHNQTIAVHIQVSISADSYPDFFYYGLFWGLSDVHKYSGGLYMAPSSLDKYAAGCK